MMQFFNIFNCRCTYEDVGVFGKTWDSIVLAYGPKTEVEAVLNEND